MNFEWGTGCQTDPCLLIFPIVGIPQEKMAHPFNYMFTTASKTVCIDFPSILDAVEKKSHMSATNENMPLCGFGFGLATSKLVREKNAQ